MPEVMSVSKVSCTSLGIAAPDLDGGGAEHHVMTQSANSGHVVSHNSAMASVQRLLAGFQGCLTVKIEVRSVMLENVLIRVCSW